MSKVFSPQTLGAFENAAASIVLRGIVRAFETAAIGLGQDPGGVEGTRKVQFRRYVASVDQHDPAQLERLGRALGALVGEVADSKVEFLVGAAARDGFAFTDGVFRPAETGPRAFALSSVADLETIEDLGRRLRVLADDAPADAVAGAAELVASVFAVVSQAAGKTRSGKTAGHDDVGKSTLEALRAVETALNEMTDPKRATKSREPLSARHARLAARAAVAVALFMAETDAERNALR